MCSSKEGTGGRSKYYVAETSLDVEVVGMSMVCVIYTSPKLLCVSVSLCLCVQLTRPRRFLVR
jgi:hypothetical protein